MKTLIFLILFTTSTTLFLVLVGYKEYKSNLQIEKDPIEKATYVNGRIDTEFLEKTFGPANE